MIELVNARRRIELMVGLLDHLANDIAFQVNYIVDLTPQESYGLSILHDRITKALIILKETI